jgi:capsular exopolysaccharide synthesis family protein
VQQAAAELATLNREIQQEQTRVLTQARQAFDAASTDERKTFATLADKKSAAFTKQSDMVQYQILLHDYESSRSLYEGLMQRLRQAGIVAGLESSEVDVVDMARVPGKPSEVGRAATILLGTIFGLGTGLAAATLVVQFDQRLEDLSSIESELGMPLLSITMKGAKDAADSVALKVPEMFLKRPNSPFVESMWSLRTSLLLSTPGRTPQTILFTSCNMGEGKSTIAAAQACALALRDARVLLIDGDLRRPTIARRVGLRNSTGLASLLSGGAELETAIQPVEGIPNLSVLPSGPIPPSAALVLASDTMARLMETLKQRYEFLIIDSPPVLGVVDAATLAQFADATVLVLSYDQLRRMQIQRAGEVLRRVGRSITGIALNFADPGSLVDYGYGYGYRYGSDATDDHEKGVAS